MSSDAMAAMDMWRLPLNYILSLCYHDTIISSFLSLSLYLEDPIALFEQLDSDGGGELSLQERNSFLPASALVGLNLLWQELDEDAGFVLYHFQEFTVAKYKRGVEDYAGMAGMAERSDLIFRSAAQWQEFMRSVGECDAWDPYDEVKITFECFAQMLAFVASIGLMPTQYDHPSTSC